MKPICKCGEEMRRSRRRALTIDGWVCMGWVHEIIKGNAKNAEIHHDKPIKATDWNK